MGIAEIIQTVRVQKGWTQEELAAKAGTTRNTIARIENERFTPRFDNLLHIIKALDLDIQVGSFKVSNE